MLGRRFFADVAIALRLKLSGIVDFMAESTKLSSLNVESREVVIRLTGHRPG
jgi:hypothetical protein